MDEGGNAIRPYPLIRTYDHTRGEWLPAFDRTVTPPEWCCLTA